MIQAEVRGAKSGAPRTCGGVVHVALVALLGRVLPLAHVVRGVVGQRGHEQAAHPQREGDAAREGGTQPTSGS